MWNADAAKKIGVFLERIWPPGDAPAGWVSQIGGRPNLPPEWEWPHIEFGIGEGEFFAKGEFEGQRASLDFLAQIRLEDLPNVPDRNMLPEKGVLFFFALALSAGPLSEFGSDAWRVLYYPGDVSGLPRRPSPSDAGWFLDDVDYGLTEAGQYRDPDAPLKDLFPRCPVRAIAAPSWKRPDAAPYESEGKDWRALVESWPGALPGITSFKYKEEQLPLRVEDALLYLNFARNEWREGILSFDDLFQRHYKLSEVSVEAKEQARLEYGAWLKRAKAASAALLARGRPALLSEDERELIRQLVAEDDARRKSLGLYAHTRRLGAAFLAMATLLMDFPELAGTIPDEIAATHPANMKAQGHRMLGHSQVVQEDIADDKVLLLQLGSDSIGPRFMWWDVGNLTFSISRADLAASRSDRVEAKIEGH